MSRNKRTGIKTLKVGYNKVFGYYIEISRGSADQAPADYIRKQTLVNAERFITPEMKEYETLVLNAEEHIREIEARLFREVCNQLSSQAKRLLETSRALAELDVLAALAEAAVLHNYHRPELVEDATLEIEAGRHPVVEHTLQNDRFVPNDTVLESGELIRIITGPNMSGKSTFLRQVALIVLMAQMGSFVPAASARIGLVDRIFTRIGAQDEIHAGQSTFMVEMIEAANILNHATPRSLLVLDEIGRGTSTYDGLSIAWAVVEYIHNHPGLRARTLFATHFHELTQLAELLPGIRNYNVAVSESDGVVVFLHKIIPGGADRSYGIHVAQLAGLPQPGHSAGIRAAAAAGIQLRQDQPAGYNRRKTTDGALPGNQSAASGAGAAGSERSFPHRGFQPPLHLAETISQEEILKIDPLTGWRRRLSLPFSIRQELLSIRSGQSIVPEIPNAVTSSWNSRISRLAFKPTTTR